MPAKDDQADALTETVEDPSALRSPDSDAGPESDPGPDSVPDPDPDSDPDSDPDPDRGPGHWRRRALKARLFGGATEVARVGRFIVLDSLGSGGMGSVLRAYDETLDRQIAVKLMHPSIKGTHDHRALREAQALARLSHPNVVQVYEVGEVDDQLFIAMELIHGQTLGDWQAEQPPWRRCLDVYIQAGRGLAAAHAAGMVHRDFKPNNCIIDDEGRVRVLDFGLARGSGLDLPESDSTDSPIKKSSSSEMRRSRPPIASISASMLEKKLTATGSVMGTVAYMAPEQLHGRETDARADQFSFCVSLYEALYGARPFTENPVASLLKMTAGERVSPAPPPSGSLVPRWLFKALERGLAGEPDDRWPSMDALIDALEKRLRRRSLGWATVGLLGVAGGLLWRSAFPEATTTPDAPADPCADASTRAAGHWDASTRARVEQAMLTTGVPWAQSTWESVDTQLSRYVTWLESGYNDACRATHVDSVATMQHLERRYACLDKRIGAFNETLRVLEGADRQVMRSAVNLVVNLPDPALCADIVDAPVGPEAQPVDLETAEANREAIQRARTLLLAGKLDKSLSVLDPLVSAADERDDAVLLAEVNLLQGRLRAKQEQFDAAAELLGSAMSTALEHGQQRLAVEALSTLTFIVGVEQAQFATGLWLGRTAAGLVEYVEPDGRAKAEVLTKIGQVHAERGEFAAAKTRLEDAIALFTELFGPEHLTLAEPLNSLGVAVSKQQPERAMEHYRRALDIRVKWLGRRHPDAILSRINLGTALLRLSEWKAARTHLYEALELLEATDTPSLQRRAQVLLNLGGSYAYEKDFESALDPAEQAVAAWEQANGPTHPRVAAARTTLGSTLYQLHRYEEALAELEQAQSIIEQNEPTPENEAIADDIRKNLKKTRAKLSSSGVDKR